MKRFRVLIGRFTRLFIKPHHLVCSAETFRSLSWEFNVMRKNDPRVDFFWAGVQIFIDDRVPPGRIHQRRGAEPSYAKAA